MPKYCPSTNKDDCNRACRGFQCRKREDARERVALAAVVDFSKPIHPNMQVDAWDEWKSIRDLS